MIEFRIALAGANHIQDLQRIELSAGQLFADIGMHSIAGDSPPEDHELQDHIDNSTLWVAVDKHDPKLVFGYAAASVVDGEGHLDQVSVDPSAQGKGVGTALVETVCSWALSAGFDAITLTTFVEVAWNGPYYRRLQFVTVPEHEWGPELRAIRQDEIQKGIDVAPRAAMRRVLSEN